MLTSLVLVLGQVFHCCRISEAMAALVSHGLEHLEGAAHPEGEEGHPPLVTHHAACHATGAAPGETTAHPIQTEEPCLSEADLALEGVEPGSSQSVKLFPPPRVAHTLPRPRSVPFPAVPRATGDLPPYLLTLRLLV